MVQLPDIEHDAGLITDWLMEREGPRRRPEQTGRVLALAGRLHLDGRRPWPVRRQVSAHTGVSLPMIDKVISRRQATGDISVDTGIRKGNVKKHQSKITDTFIRPSRELIKILMAPKVAPEPSSQEKTQED